MTVLSSPYRIKSSLISSSAGLNNQFMVEESHVNAVGNQSTRVKDYAFISYSNRLEIQKVRSFSDLEKDWDSYGAEVISDQVIVKAVGLIHEIDKLDEEVYFTSPGPNGEVMIQLKKNDREVEFILYPNKMKYVTFQDGEFKNQGDFQTEIISELIEWLNL